MFPTLARFAAAAVVAFAPLLVPVCEAKAQGLPYQQPRQALIDVIDAPTTPLFSVSPDERVLLLLHTPNLPSIIDLAAEELRLAGVRIDPATNGPSRGMEIRDLSLLPTEGGDERRVTGLPDPPRIRNVNWSPDGRTILFTQTVTDGIELWIVDVASARARRLIGPRSNLAVGSGPRWMPDSRSILVALVPAGRGPRPEPPLAPTGPNVQENLGRTTPARTYQDLLENPHHENLFEYYFTAQLGLVDLDGELVEIGAPGIHSSFDPSPNGEYLLVETIQRPFSYLVPANRFPRRVEVWDRDGGLVQRLADKPLQDAIPIAFGSVETGPRAHAWRADAPATLVYAEAQDDGDAGRSAELRDRVYLLTAPFRGRPVELASLEQRFGGVSWGNGDLALVNAWWWQTRRQQVWRVRPDKPKSSPELLIDRSSEDRYNDPGRPVMIANAVGRSVLRTDGRHLFLIGNGASEEGDRPFLDRFDLRQRTSERLFRSEAPYFEQPMRLLDEDGTRVLTRRESTEEVPNYFVRDLRSGELTAVTHFEHPTPSLLGIQKELIRYDRADGVKLTGTLYTPAGYEPQRDGPLPVLMWAYPTEFKSADAAGQVTDSPYRFVRTSWASPILWLLAGYAVLDDPTMPIVGEGDSEPNDTYVEQLVSSAKAAVDELVKRGVGDRDRMAIGGHSYGAFMTANLLAHSDLFAAGIARSGAYNRTLTPFGFQAEERTFWQAPEVYMAMSPFAHAEKIDEPLLIVHGEADNNSGTFPMQSERLYSAMKGLGGTARLVMLPHESHGYRARESILHMLWETEQWLETYVKGAPLPDGLQRAGAGAGDR
jgi:dipeptidyl aminopeptidase/acylaminoacyl peptidase